jgi:uncharacterized linocin/CFP29 family protein
VSEDAMSAIDVTSGPLADNGAPTKFGRGKIGWEPAVWDRIDAQVCAELCRSRVATKFLPVVNGSLAPSARTVPADAFQVDDGSGTLFIPEGAELPLEERTVPFVLTKQQYEAEDRLATALTLATRAANRLAQDMDYSVFQGSPNGSLLRRAEEVQQIVDVPLLNPNHPPEEPDKYGENTFEAVAAAYALLESKGHYGPDALVCHFEAYADAHAPLPSTLIMPADRIRSLMSAGFYGTGTLPAKRAVMVSTGGNTVDVAIAVDATAAFTDVDRDEIFNFRVYERFTVRVKDPTALVLLRFA